MAIKKFSVCFNSKKTAHPDGEVTHVFEVSASTKKNAVSIAEKLLQETDEQHYMHYKGGYANAIVDNSDHLPDKVEDTRSEPIAEYEIEDAEPKTTDKEESPEFDSELVTEPEPIPQPEPEPKTEQPEEYVFKNGTYDMPNHVYHASNGISSSMLKKACESMMLYKKTYITKEIKQPKSDALVFGNLFHTLTLEPHLFEEEFILLDDTIDRRTKAGREAWDIIQERALSKNMQIVTQEQYDLALAMANTAVNNRYANKLLRAPTRRTEVSFFDTHPTTGLTVKVRPDLIVGDVCVDLKSIYVNRSVDSEWMLEHLRREVIRYKYHLSAAMYLDVAKLKEFVWIFVNKAPGYHWVATVRAGEALLTEGDDLYHTNMHRIQNAERNDEWPGPTSILPTIQNNKIILPEI